MKTKIPAPELREFLEEKTRFYNRPSFIENDPVSIPHRFEKRGDQEIAGFFAATLAWGRREQIIKSSERLMQCMDEAPHDFILNASDQDIKKLRDFVHRTFNGEDLICFVRALRRIYQNHGGLESAFAQGMQRGDQTLSDGIAQFRFLFFQGKYPARTLKHVSNPLAGSTSKRLCMYLRWMVRNDQAGVDFGIWKKITPAQLCCPLDVHSGRVARTLGILNRNTDDWKAVEELTNALRQFDPKDPSKYDFALFGLGVNDEF